MTPDAATIALSLAMPEGVSGVLAALAEEVAALDAVLARELIPLVGMTEMQGRNADALLPLATKQAGVTDPADERPLADLVGRARFVPDLAPDRAISRPTAAPMAVPSPDMPLPSVDPPPPRVPVAPPFAVFAPSVPPPFAPGDVDVPATPIRRPATADPFMAQYASAPMPDLPPAPDAPADAPSLSARRPAAPRATPVPATPRALPPPGMPPTQPPDTNMPAAQSGASTEGKLLLDGFELGRWVFDSLNNAAMHPPSAATGFDPRLSPAWSGQVGY